MCSYILENSTRAQLVDTPLSWPYCGAIVAGYPKMDPRESGFWEQFMMITVDPNELLVASEMLIRVGRVGEVRLRVGQFAACGKSRCDFTCSSCADRPRGTPSDQVRRTTAPAEPREACRQPRARHRS